MYVLQRGRSDIDRTPFTRYRCCSSWIFDRRRDEEKRRSETLFIQSPFPSRHNERVALASTSRTKRPFVAQPTRCNLIFSLTTYTHTDDMYTTQKKHSQRMYTHIHAHTYMYTRMCKILSHLDRVTTEYIAHTTCTYYIHITSVYIHYIYYIYMNIYTYNGHGREPLLSRDRLT